MCTKGCALQYAMLRLSEEAERTAKESGAYYTPDPVAAALVRWAARSATDRLLDPSCGDGRFIACHSNSTGVERNEDAASAAKQHAPSGLVHHGDFFEWAEQSTERFDCAAGNPPFIRYQTFSGEVRRRALRLCHDLGAPFSGLTTSWAPFLVVTASLLRRGGRMAFVVPASIGHAPHAAPLIDYLVANFDAVRVVAIREKLFPHLSEDCWLLFAEGFGGSTRDIHFAPLERFRDTEVPPPCRGACAGRGVAQFVEPQAATSSARRLRACNLSGGSQEAGHMAPRYRCLGRHRLRERRERLFPRAAFGGTTVGYSG